MKIKHHISRFSALALFTLLFLNTSAQEQLGPLSGNLQYQYKDLQPTVGTVPALNTQQRAASLFLPFLDDFYYASSQLYASPLLWQDSLVYINQGFPIAPPSIGVATFDGLNRHGYPYTTLGAPDLNSSSAADTLTSRPINLFVTSSSQTLTPSDKIGLSFYYQARGYGEAPEGIDSLILDFYKPHQNKWQNRVWSMRGSTNPNTNDSAFKRAFLYLRDTSYLHNGFMFRFRNKATNSGDFDHWHVDYVYLNTNRDSLADTLYNDVTFARVPTSFLKNYNTMPWEQYDANEMAKNNSVRLKNNYSSNINIYYAIGFRTALGANQYTYSAQANNIPSFKTIGYFNNAAFSNPASHPTFTYSYPLLTDSADFNIKHFIYRSGANNDFITDNDTVMQYQRFRNYYAHDDGGAEGGYYVLGTGAEMAVKIKVNTTDTFRGLRVYFDPAPLGSANKFYFKIRLYSGSTLPQNLIYTSEALYPKYINKDYRPFPEYELKTPLLLNPGTYFVGIQQQLSTGLVVGFDKNSYFPGSLVFNAGKGWEASGYAGALMMRPVMGKKIYPPLGVQELADLRDAISIYPNPAEGTFNIYTGTDNLMEYSLLNQLGQEVLRGSCMQPETPVNTNNLSAGLYFVKISSGSNLISQHKLIIRN